MFTRDHHHLGRLLPRSFDECLSGTLTADGPCCDTCGGPRMRTRRAASSHSTRSQLSR